MTDASDDAPSARRSTAAVAACLLGIAALLVLDLGTKAWALDHLSVERVGDAPPVCEPNDLGNVVYQRMRGEVVDLVPGYLELRYAENCGAAFGLMRSAHAWLRRVVFGVAAVLASIALLVMFARGRGGPLFGWSVPFIVAGALGNLVDRARLGYVVDFIRFHVHDTWEWPTFNIADSAITVGVVLLALEAFLDWRREQREASGAGDDGAPQSP